MRILYSAIDQQVPGVHGGAVHVTAVAEGLTAIGHDVHVLASPGEGPFPGCGAWEALTPPLGARQLRWMRAGRVRAAAERVRADVVIERYYNFGGEGVRATRATGALAVLEVNAPIVDHTGSAKWWLDRALVMQPMRRWRDWQCRHAGLIVTPSAGIVPEWARERTVEIEWGADTARFHPGAAGPVPFTPEPGTIVAIFAGAFRRWHGAVHLVEATRRLRARGDRDIRAVFVGEGPERQAVGRAAAGLDGVVMAGPVAHDLMPACLAAADIGVAPFDVEAHGPLRLGFYWSPLKIFEYMAAGLPVVTPDLERLRHIVRDGREGLLYDARDPEGLAGALERLRDPALRRTLGAAARERVVREFGWDVHCRRLEAAILDARRRRRASEQ